MPTQQTITLIGAGLSGSLLAIYLAKRGYQVEVYEKRGDMRKMPVEAGRSINLALSARGIQALQAIGIADTVLQTAIPMYGRMLHALDGALTFVRYGKDDSEYINSISRAGLNQALLEVADEFPNVNFHFQHVLSEVDLAANQLIFNDLQNKSLKKISSDLNICTDGAGSVVRQAMVQKGITQESVDFLSHGYKELNIPASAKGDFQMEKNALHIWPRGAYMLIALPNADGSFTCTLFFPNEGEISFAGLDTADKVKAFFQEKFADSIPLIPHLTEEFLHNPVGLLGTVHAAPWYFADKFLLLGDSAHAIVPFYGQGMNCCFEDCYYLDQIIEKSAGNWQKIFQEFQQIRKPNADAIAELALENFIEMRDGTANPAFLRKRQLENILENQYPDYHSKYSLVTFHPEVSYVEAHQRGNWQDAFLLKICEPIQSIEELNIEEIYFRLKNEYK
ncbi:MAG: FAD-dependent monooxygenase [Microscillaceae bacterium]|jgi:kynurenine 3-monooxygenase|nr:FAD-dependent monooxygenase [Microscillaceae bacterium]